MSEVSDVMNAISGGKASGGSGRFDDFLDNVKTLSYSLGSSVKDAVKNHKKLSAIATGVLGLALSYGAYGIHRATDANVVYDGVLEDDRNTRVKYIEGEDGNEMIAKRNGSVWEMYDTKDTTSIDWGSETKPNFQDDRLERIVIRMQSGKEMPDGRDRWVFEVGERNNGTIYGTTSAQAFDTANGFYNSRRSLIREEKQKEYLEAFKRENFKFSDQELKF